MIRCVICVNRYFADRLTDLPGCIRCRIYLFILAIYLRAGRQRDVFQRSGMFIERRRCRIHFTHEVVEIRHQLIERFGQTTDFLCALFIEADAQVFIAGTGAYLTNEADDRPGQRSAKYRGQ